MAFSRKKAPPFKSAAGKCLFIICYVSLPFIISVTRQSHPFRILFSFYAVSLFICFYLLKSYFNQKERLDYQSQEANEQINIINNENEKELKSYVALQAQIIRYNSLKKIVEEINQNLVLDSTAEQLINASFSLISANHGVGLLYRIDNQTQKLILFKTKQEDKKLIIKAKEGDMFDNWVLRHAVSLIIEDVKKDFRFDPEKLKAQDLRPVASLISSPFISENRFLGILRLDNKDRNFYSQDDLRFLVRICDLGAVALENSELFAKTQELAIHDELTAFYTKGYFLKHLQEECEKSVRRNSIFSLLMLDIDFFKNYNDKFGHTAGDIVLRKISQLIRDTLKDVNGFASRFGGEEFCIILPGMDKEGSYAIAKRICGQIAKEKIILRRQETSVTVSIGLSNFPVDAENPEELINKADRGMYEAKKKGRNQVCCI